VWKIGYTGRDRENDIKGVKRIFAKSITQAALLNKLKNINNSDKS
jgi:hypothetical protein